VLDQVLPINKTVSIAAMMPVPQFEEKDYLLMATQEGLIKKAPLSQFQDVRANGLIALKLKVLLLPCSCSVMCHGQGFCSSSSFHEQTCPLLQTHRPLTHVIQSVQDMQHASLRCFELAASRLLASLLSVCCSLFCQQEASPQTATSNALTEQHIESH